MFIIKGYLIVISIFCFFNICLKLFFFIIFSFLSIWYMSNIRLVYGEVDNKVKKKKKRR